MQQNSLQIIGDLKAGDQFYIVSDRTKDKVCEVKSRSQKFVYYTWGKLHVYTRDFSEKVIYLKST
jgi:hypothetical protein